MKFSRIILLLLFVTILSCTHDNDSYISGSKDNEEINGEASDEKDSEEKLSYLRISEIVYKYDGGHTSRTEYSYDGKKPITTKQYYDDVLTYSSTKEFSGLSYSEVSRQYDSVTGKLMNTTYSQGEYLDDTYLRISEIVYKYDGGHTGRTEYSYDGKKPIATKQYYDDVLTYSSTREFSSLSYSEVSRQYDSVTGKLMNTTYSQGEYLDDTYLRISEIVYKYDGGHTGRTEYSYDGKKPIATKQYYDDVLTYSSTREFSGLSYSEVSQQYDSMTGELINTTYSIGTYMD